MEASGYSLDLYCDNKNHITAWGDESSFFDEKPSACRAKARKEGWVFHRDGKHSCPKCSGKARNQ